MYYLPTNPVPMTDMYTCVDMALGRRVTLLPSVVHFSYNNIKVKNAVDLAVSKTMSYLKTSYENDKMDEMSDEEDTSRQSDCYDSDDHYERSKCHWVRQVREEEVIALAKSLCVHGVFDLGLKNSKLPCFCPFENRFFCFWEKSRLSHLITKKQCCQNRNTYGQKYTEWSKADLLKHCQSKYEGKVTEFVWPYYLLFLLIHALYDYFNHDMHKAPEDSQSKGKQRTECFVAKR